MTWNLSRYAIALALATFLLLIAGNLVSTTESGLACPDWPLCEGRWIPQMVDGKQFEHTHRLVAAFVGAMTFGLTALLMKHRRKDRLLVGLGWLAAALVTVQALLGALTVKLKLPAWVSSTHLATAMAFFCLTVSLAFLLHRRSHGFRASQQGPGLASLGRFTLVSAAAVYAQVVVGGVMRHTRAGLACGFDLPLCHGEVWPFPGYAGIHIHMIHRVGGVLVGLCLLWLAVRLWRASATAGARAGWLRVCAVLLGAGVVAQVALGILTVLWSRDLPVMTLHSGLGAALLAVTVATCWLVRPGTAASAAAAPLSAPSSLEVA